MTASVASKAGRAVDAQLHWIKDPIKNLESLSRGVKNRMMRIGLNKASVPLAEAMRASVPRDTKALSQSIRTKNYNPGGGKKKDSSTWLTIIGPGSGLIYPRLKSGKIAKGALSKKKKLAVGKVKFGRKNFVRPAYYGYIVDSGSKYITPSYYRQKALARGKAVFQQTFFGFCQSDWKKYVK